MTNRQRKHRLNIGRRKSNGAWLPWNRFATSNGNVIAAAQSVDQVDRAPRFVMFSDTVTAYDYQTGRLKYWTSGSDWLREANHAQA